jgi:kinesin family protein C1
MIPRAVHQIFLAAASLKEKGWEYTMEASFLEIYNESIRDLLGSNDPSKKFEIKHGQNNSTTMVTELTTSMTRPC